MDFKLPALPSDIGTRALTDVNRFYELRQVADSRQQADEIARQMETVFVDMMMSAMRRTVPEDGLFGQSAAVRTYTEMLDKQMVQMGGLQLDQNFHEALVRSIEPPLDSAELAVQRAQGRVAELEAGEARYLTPAELASIGDQLSQALHKSREAAGGNPPVDNNREGEAQSSGR